jgi:hypothetical protein
MFGSTGAKIGEGAAALTAPLNTTDAAEDSRSRSAAHAHPSTSWFGWRLASPARQPDCMTPGIIICVAVCEASAVVVFVMACRRSQSLQCGEQPQRSASVASLAAAAHLQHVAQAEQHCVFGKPVGAVRKGGIHA